MKSKKKKRRKYRKRLTPKQLMNEDTVYYGKNKIVAEIVITLTEVQTEKLNEAIEESDIHEEISFKDFEKMFLREIGKVKPIV